MSTIGLDPGTTRTAWIELGANGVPVNWAWEANETVVRHIRRNWYRSDSLFKFAIEWITSQGMAVGKDIFDTVRWVGRFQEAYERPPNAKDTLLIPRSDIKLDLCGSARAKDANVRQALIDFYGGQQKAIGGVKCKRCKGRGWSGRGRPTCLECAGSGWQALPGPLYGISGHCWSALSVAVVARGQA